MAQTLAGAVHSDLSIKKSRFIGCVQPMQDRASAQAAVDALWKQHPGATHICWALLAGGHSAAVDDGEPGGTAGRPMLEVLRHQDLEGVLATVVRYFGGVKLGAGGLLRAYTDCVAQALKDAEKVTLQRSVQLACRFPYAFEGAVRRELQAAGAQLLAAEHASLVCLAFALPETEAQALVERLADASHGSLVWDSAEPSLGKNYSFDSY
jgi:uncharacterized YigZ family protein